jgi:DUF1680 family protein
MNTVRRRMEPVRAGDVRVEGAFWARRLETNRRETLPAEFVQLKRVGTLGAYQWKWPEDKDRPWRIWVGDLGKWIEAVSYTLMAQPDDRLARLARQAVNSIVRGQKPDGYLYSNPMAPELRWTNLQELHELYDVGHTIEGAVAYHQATGDRRFLDAMCRCADLLDANFGWEKGKKKGCDGHPEIELALVKLYRVTGERRYLNLARFFVDVRGTRPNYFDLEKEEARRRGIPLKGWVTNYEYLQAHVPLREQRDAVGHAVRALYLYSGAADVAAETNDIGLMAACRRLWRSVVQRRMYVTGGVGSTAHGEAFTFDYDLPNETAYAETCANIALVFFAHRMLQMEADARYADVMERALYNGVLSGVSLDGKRFFYANHLTVFPRALQGAHGHIAAQRQEWFGCACCPPNIARIIASVGSYAYSVGSDSLYVHLYVGGRVQSEVAGAKVALRVETDYPWDERVRVSVEPDSPAVFTLALRIPGWCRAPALKVNGSAMALKPIVRKGYARIRRPWRRGDRVELILPMPVERIEANPRVRMDCGKVALQRGPIVYCLEETDNGANLADLFLPRESELKAERRRGLLGGVVVLQGKARRRSRAGWNDVLYRSARSESRAVDILAVPYCVWGNRRPGEMLVWIRGD